MAVGLGSGEIFLVDVNHDRHLDLVTKHLLKQRLSVWSGDGKGHFAPAAAGSIDFDVMPGAVTLGDVNNDGILDLGVSSKTRDRETVRILFGNRKGGFNPVSAPPILAGISPEGREYKPVLRFVDLNEDDNLDLISANGWRSAVETFIGNGRGGFSPGAVVQLAQGPWVFSFAIGDLDGDRHLDVVTSMPGQPSESGTGRVETRRGVGNGRFAGAVTQAVRVGPDPRVAAIADLNADGHADVVLSHARRNTLSVLVNSGTGAFTLQQGPSINVEAPASEVVAVDVNRDKNVDLLATLVDMTAPFASKIVVLLADGRGEFRSAPGSPFPATAAAYRLAVGDVNEDGKVDIATSSFESDAVTLLLGR